MFELISVNKVWDQGEHNAFTDLCAFDGHFWLVFREASAHVSNDGVIRVLKSQKGEVWQEATVISMPNIDLRDPKIIVTPDNNLLITTVGVERTDRSADMQSYLYLSDNGNNWGKPITVGRLNEWIWRTRFIEGEGFGVSYTPGEEKASLHKLSESSTYQLWVDDLFSKKTHGLGYPNEHDLFTLSGGRMGCLLRRDADTSSAQLGVSEPPFKDWQWHDLGVRVGGPVVLPWSENKLLAAVRLYEPVRTSLCLLDVKNFKLDEVLPLPSGGDTSYAGLVVKGSDIYCAYYSSHEGKTAIYMAVIKSAPEAI